MQGFGATTLSLVFGPQDNVPNPTLRALANDAAFNQIKLNMGNLEVEPSEAPASNVYAPANDDDDPFTITAAGFNWVQSDRTCAAASYTFTTSSNTPMRRRFSA